MRTIGLLLACGLVSCAPVATPMVAPTVTLIGMLAGALPPPPTEDPPWPEDAVRTAQRYQPCLERYVVAKGTPGITGTPGLVGITDLTPVLLEGAARRHPPAVFLDVRLNPVRRFEVLAHEIGHLDQPGTIRTEVEAEVWAELYAVHIGARFGLDLTGIALRYLIGTARGDAGLVRYFIGQHDEGVRAATAWAGAC